MLVTSIQLSTIVIGDEMVLGLFGATAATQKLGTVSSAVVMSV